MTVAALLAAAAAAVPIPQGPNADSLPAFAGHAVAPRPLSAPSSRRHPHMAPNGRSNIHDDAYQSDTYTGLGPLATGNRSTSDQDRPDFAKNGPISRYRVRRMGIQAIPMSERNV